MNPIYFHKITGDIGTTVTRCHARSRSISIIILSILYFSTAPAIEVGNIAEEFESSINIYIYIYVYVCVCVCVFVRV